MKVTLKSWITFWIVSDVVLLVVSGIGFVMLAVTMYSIIITCLKSATEIKEEEGEPNNYD